MSSWSIVAPILIVITLVAVDVWCGDVSYARTAAAPVTYNNTNAWPKLPNQQNPLPPPVQPQWVRQTTPWPALGQRPYYRPASQNVPSNSPTWFNPSPNNQRYNQNPYPNHRGPSLGPQTGGGDDNRHGTSSSNLGSNGWNSGQADDNELREFSETLLTKDTNNAAKYVNVNYQAKTTSRSERDEAPEPLLSVDQEAYKIAGVKKLIALYDNYIVKSNVREEYTSQEKSEESSFLDTIIPTQVMSFTRNFLIDKGIIGRDPREFKDVLTEIWFNMYSRGGGKVGSSGFEHVFLAEIKKNQVSGLHNWLYFNEEEHKNLANYYGYMRKIDLGNKGSILKYHFSFHDIDKPVGSMFIGTSPEFEMALYTTCFLLRADKVCPLKLNGNRFIIRTYTYTYNGKKMIGSAFPEI